MRKIIFLTVSFCLVLISFAQKKPLDHTVYDSWQSIGEKMISNDGNWVVYTINPQEGDNELIIQSTHDNGKNRKTIPRGSNAVITEDSRYVIFKIKPFYKDTRQAKIKKKRNDEFPKDSLAIVELGKDGIWKTPRVKNFKTPEEGYGWVAYHLERTTDRKPGADKKQADSLLRVIDSLKSVIAEMPKTTNNGNNKDQFDADDPEPTQAVADSSSDLVLRNLQTGSQQTIRNVYEYVFSKDGRHLVVEQSRDAKDSLSKAQVVYYDLEKNSVKTLSRGGNEFRNFAISEDGSQVAYTAERDATPKQLQKTYKLWYFKNGMDSAILIADKSTTGMPSGATVSEFGELSFSKSGKRLFFGTAPVQPPKDTSLIDIDLVKLDIWHYNDDYLQTVQLNRLRRDLQENFLAVYLVDQRKMVQLGSKELPQIIRSNEGDGDQFVGVTDFGKRIESQWEGTTKKDVYAVNLNDGTKKQVIKDLSGVITSAYQSPTGKYIMWYDGKAKNYFVWDGTTTKNITGKIKLPLFNEEYDSPSDPPPYGIMGWHEGDSAVYIYDKYKVWRVDPSLHTDPYIFAAFFTKIKPGVIVRYIKIDSAETFIKANQQLVFRATNDKNKESGFFTITGNIQSKWNPVPYSFNGIQKAKDKNIFIYTKENYSSSPDLIVYDQGETKLSSINPQQQSYNWGTAELFKWKAYNGKESEGIVYKPEDFDPKKKYPMICYFYETLSDGLNNYLPPSPTPSRLNIPFFVSRGYIVFAPDIHYGTGHPGKDAYDYVVSGARALVKQGFVDSTRLGLQGQSWGGYQVAYIVTATTLFKAAWAGAPVANMTSAYGGIRWESGLTRQFQYERTQSRIGATLWEKPQLYIDNSPLFRLPKVKTPLVIMANDADGAVPWYQGIELFTAMRRLGKKVWMLNYNGEAHNLVERRNRKDIQIREQQFFDWLLKDEAPTKWLTEGVPAVKKGKEWGLE